MKTSGNKHETGTIGYYESVNGWTELVHDSVEMFS
jgi:hypothetical protein